MTIYEVWSKIPLSEKQLKLGTLFLKKLLKHFHTEIKNIIKHVFIIDV
jgi:hypothetical protein